MADTFEVPPDGGNDDMAAFEAEFSGASRGPVRARHHGSDGEAGIACESFEAGASELRSAHEDDAQCWHG